MIWVCVICNAEQKDNELQCWKCGNILPEDFREKDIADEVNNKEKHPTEATIPAPKEVKSMVEEAPHIEEKEYVDIEDVIEKPKKKKRKKKKG